MLFVDWTYMSQLEVRCPRKARGTGTMTPPLDGTAALAGNAYNPAMSSHTPTKNWAPVTQNKFSGKTQKSREKKY